MTLYEARNILGPVRAYYDRTFDCWCMDGVPATRKRICQEAYHMWRRMDHKRHAMILATPLRA